jgi:alpha-amylase
LSAWLGNAMQSNAIHELYRLEKKIKASEDQNLINDWRKMQTSDHFYYMCTKWFADGDVHKYFNPYDSPYESYINFMNILGNLQGRCARHQQQAVPAGAVA